MENNNTNNTKIFFKFQKSPDYKQIHASGLWGSVMPSGDLYFTIYEEIPEIPEQTELVLDQNNPFVTKEEPINHSDTQIIDRIMHVGVTMPIEVIPSIIQWLQNKLDEYQAAKQLSSSLQNNKPLKND